MLAPNAYSLKAAEGGHSPSSLFLDKLPYFHFYVNQYPEIAA